MIGKCRLVPDNLNFFDCFNKFEFIYSSNTAMLYSPSFLMITPELLDEILLSFGKQSFFLTYIKVDSIFYSLSEFLLMSSYSSFFYLRNIYARICNSWFSFLYSLNKTVWLFFYEFFKILNFFFCN